MEYLERVVALANVQDPVEQPSIQDWTRVEEDLAIALPGDYKALITRLGCGRFGDLVLLNPASTSLDWNLNQKTLMDLQDGCIQSRAKEAGLLIFPKPDAYLPIGFTGFGRLLLVQLMPTMGANYGICWFDWEIPEALFLSISVSQFLHDLYLGVFDEEWARIDRDSIWESGAQPFFTSWRGDPSAVGDSLNW
jgi:hypothetical protein